MKENLINKLPRNFLSPELIFLDTGMVTELTDTDRRNLVGFFDAFTRLDGEETGKWVLRLQYSRPESEKKLMSTSCKDPK